MIEELLLQTSDTGPRSRSKPRLRRAAAMRAVWSRPTGIGAQGTVLMAMHTNPPSWSVAAMRRWRETPRRWPLIAGKADARLALGVFVTTRRAPDGLRPQTAMTT